MEIIQILIRALQFLWTLLITALIGNVIANNRNGHMASINFAMFVAVLSWLALLYGLVAAFIESIAIPVAMIVLDGLAVLFTFISAVVLAAKLTAVNCGGNFHNKGSGWIGFGSSNTEKRCREIQASTAFMWFLFASFAASLALAAIGFRRMGGSMRSSRPTMSQVRV
ncbi:marvel domain-containing protein [Phialemonium atrogriseum]|uniref:Marvel domain-containing protein n=1 Tax=Phialemonium atrogriseum TaxID=1093897 RepID=A0AAJ0C6T4_9PEZI|nr:marvel domain-containing protein [Phialemonium atrogriseum]KAK1771218.1 marvel domain-containing protein [Phialemonium atrogriseum]